MYEDRPRTPWLIGSPAVARGAAAHPGAGIPMRRQPARRGDDSAGDPKGGGRFSETVSEDAAKAYREAEGLESMVEVDMMTISEPTRLDIPENFSHHFRLNFRQRF